MNKHISSRTMNKMTLYIGIRTGVSLISTLIPTMIVAVAMFMKGGNTLLGNLIGNPSFGTIKITEILAIAILVIVFGVTLWISVRIGYFIVRLLGLDFSEQN